jgi:glycosyltransferase involved in cell wall biosynthesis
MRIGMLFPSIYASLKLFPDKIFAPRELCIDLVNGLVGKGHEVSVYSVPDLPVKAKLVSEPLEPIIKPLHYHKFRGMGESQQKNLEQEFAKHAFELQVITNCYKDAKKGKLDVIHVYMDSSMFLSHYIEEAVGSVPVVYTLHDPLPSAGAFEYEALSRFSKHRYVSISNSFRHSPLQLNFVETVYHGIDTSIYPFNETPDDYYLFLGRLVPEKGLIYALKATIASGNKLVVSTNFPKPGETNSYYDSLAKELQNPLITNIGVVSKSQRIDLYRRAKALLFPIEWEEPFGIVLIEAMACGTPVIAYNRGSVPEIVKDGVTGFIVTNLQEGMKRIGEIDRRECRTHVESHFSVSNMIDGYERVYTNSL